MITNFHTPILQGLIMKWITRLFFSPLFVLFTVSLGLTQEATPELSPKIAPVLNQEQPCNSTLWPHEKSELSPDPALIFGRLDNGFRFILLKNQEPKGRVAMFLNVQTGSLYETDQQQGLAHFLEHMVFNGTTHFPPGALIDYFQSIGMSYGGDTNAHTSFDETVYHLLLPGASQDELSKGLLVMADYARGALLLSSEIERERGVILSEKRARDSVEYRTHVAEMAFTMRGSRIPERMPIGIPDTLNKADHKEIKAFYDAWYRPEKMILVMVGDFDPAQVKPLIHDQFKGLQGTGTMPDCPQWGQVNHTGPDFLYHHEPEMGFTELTLETVWNESEKNDSLALQRQIVHTTAANRLIQYRLEQLLEKKETPFTAGTAYSGVFSGRIGYGALSVTTDADKWQPALNEIDQILRQALAQGFSQQELQRIQKELLSELDAAVLTAGTRDSQKLAANLIRNLNDNKVLLSPQQEKEVLSPLVTAMTSQDLQSALQMIWQHPARLVIVAGNATLSGDDPRLQIKKAYDEATSRKLSLSQASTTDLTFPYLHLAADPRPPQEQSLPAIQAHRLTLANGIIVNLKPTTFQNNEVQVTANFGTGKQGEPHPGLAILAEQVIENSGTGQFTRSELDRIVAGSTVKLTFKMGEESCILRGSAITSDLELLFQLLQARLIDFTVRDEAYSKAMQGFANMYKQMEQDVSGVMKLSGESFLAGGNPTFGLPSWKEFSSLQAEQIRVWLQPAFTVEGLEVTVVGDFDLKHMRELVTTTLAPLGQRNQAVPKSKPIHFPAGKTLRLTAPSSIDKAMLVVAWPTADFWDIDRTRRLYLLTEVFADRLRKVIREQLGATYSPEVSNHPSRIYADYGILRAQLIVAPDQIDTLAKAVMQVANELRETGISSEELERAKAPMLTSLKDLVRTNGYWLNSVLSLSSRHPQQLQWPATILSGFNEVRTEHLSALATEYLHPSKAAQILIVPEKKL